MGDPGGRSLPVVIDRGWRFSGPLSIARGVRMIHREHFPAISDSDVPTVGIDRPKMTNHRAEALVSRGAWGERSVWRRLAWVIVACMVCFWQIPSLGMIFWPPKDIVSD